MSCKICGRGSCSESFHSIEEQENFEKYSKMLSKLNDRDIISLLEETENYIEREAYFIELVEELNYLKKSFINIIKENIESYDLILNDYQPEFQNIEKLNKVLGEII